MGRTFWCLPFVVVRFAWLWTGAVPCCVTRVRTFAIFAVLEVRHLRSFARVARGWREPFDVGRWR